MTHSQAFDFRAVRRDGAVESGTIEAATREAAISLLSSRGAFPISVSTAPSPQGNPRKVNSDELAQGVRALATLLASGVPLARALVILEDLAPPSWKAVLPTVKLRVEQGESLGACLRTSALGLPPHVIGLIEAGEAGSGLATAVEGSAKLLESRATTRAAMRNALTYPLMLGVAGSASVALLVGVVLPRFASLLVDVGQALPLSTRFVLNAAAVFRIAFVPGIAMMLGLAFAWRAWVAKPEGLQRWHAWLLDRPFVGPIRWSAATANAASVLTALLSVGVPVSAALPHAGRASGDRAIESRLLAVRTRIAGGQRISSAMQAEAALTPAAIRLVRVGEETGELADMLAHASRIEADQALQRLQRLVRIVEPVMVLLFGGIVMIVATSLLQAMYGLRPTA